MPRNPHRAIVLKMSYSTACDLKYLLNSFALKHIKAFEGIDSCQYTECSAFLKQLQTALDSYEGNKQVSVDVRLPARKPLM